MTPPGHEMERKRAVAEPQPEDASAAAASHAVAPEGIAPGAAASLALPHWVGNGAVSSVLARRGPASPPAARRGPATPPAVHYATMIGRDEVLIIWTVNWIPETAGRPWVTKSAFGDQLMMSLPVPAGTTGTLHVTLVAQVRHLTLGMPDNDYENLHSSVDWTVDVGNDGSVKPGKGRTQIRPNTKSKLVKQSDLGADSQPDVREFTVSPKYVSTQDSSSASVPVVGGYEESTTEPADLMAPTFLVTIEPQGVVEPTVTATVSDIQQKRSYAVYFASEEQVTMEEDAGNELMRWFVGLNAKTLQRLRLKQPRPPIQLDAFTSDTGPSSHNRKVADGRRDVVMKTIGDHVHPENWAATSWGEDLHPENDRKLETPDAKRRVVQITLFDDMTDGATDKAVPDLLLP
jgi:hypothetical protein